jgi:hypothetical protein
VPRLPSAAATQLAIGSNVDLKIYLEQPSQADNSTREGRHEHGCIEDLATDGTLGKQIVDRSHKRVSKMAKFFLRTGG